LSVKPVSIALDASAALLLALFLATGLRRPPARAAPCADAASRLELLR
jgi:hypothetical protein